MVQKVMQILFHSGHALGHDTSINIDTCFSDGCPRNRPPAISDHLALTFWVVANGSFDGNVFCK